MLVHGAGSGPWVWQGWSEALPGMSVTAVDLHRGRDVAATSMWDYTASVYEAAEVMPTPLALCGWDMGGLVVAMAARTLRPESVVLIEPSPPLEVRGEEDVLLERGTYDPEEIAGPFPPGMAPRPESALARAERLRGISVPSLPCRSLVVSGRRFGEERGRRIAELYGSEHEEFPDLDHWDLVLDPRVPPTVARFLAR